MTNEIISYREMCMRENTSLQRGMNYRISFNHSVFLMSVRPNAPYKDKLEDDGTILIYEGHDEPKSQKVPSPKLVDQPRSTPSGALTQNGKFEQAASLYAEGKRLAEQVRVYEKLRSGIWSYNGCFHLEDSWQEADQNRKVFKFKLVAVKNEVQEHSAKQPERRRLIPSEIKLAVWQRDQGKCVVCGSSENLHFDHDLPYSKGGSSMTEKNVQLMCAKHNLSKGAKII